MTPRMFTVLCLVLGVIATALGTIGWRIWDFEAARYSSSLKAEWNSDYQTKTLIVLSDKLDKAFVQIGDSNKVVVEAIGKIQAEIDALERRVHDLEMLKK